MIAELWRVFAVEFEKTFRKGRTYIGFAALGVIVPTLLIAFRLSDGPTSSDFGYRSSAGGLQMVGSFVNGLFLVRLVLLSLFVHVPFLITLVAGDMIAGEANAGTLRLVCVRPPTRAVITTAKFAVACVYCVLLVAFLGVVAVGVGVALFGQGPLILSSNGITVVPVGEAYARVALALALGALAMVTVSAIAYALGTIVTNPIGPIIGTMAILIVCLIVTNTPLAFFARVRPYLFTSYMAVWSRAFDAPLDWGAISREASVLAGYTLGFYALSLRIFVRKDIVT